MDRLTAKYPTWGWQIKDARIMVRGDCDKYNDAIYRLAAYEDTGLTPDEIKAKLAELDRLQQDMADGEIIRLPCKVGDTVYYIDSGKYIEEETITRFVYSRFLRAELSDGNWFTFWDDESRKLLFFTREEAEKAIFGAT